MSKNVSKWVLRKRKKKGRYKKGKDPNATMIVIKKIDGKWVRAGTRKRHNPNLLKPKPPYEGWTGYDPRFDPEGSKPQSYNEIF